MKKTIYACTRCLKEEVADQYDSEDAPYGWAVVNVQEPWATVPGGVAPLNHSRVDLCPSCLTSYINWRSPEQDKK